MQFAKLFPLMQQVGGYLKVALDYYALAKNTGQSLDPDIAAAYLLDQMKDWNPTYNNVTLLDDESRKAGARFLAGVALNIVRS